MALTGIRVLDLTRVLSGPHATMILGDLGADVVKIERPHDGDETRGVVQYEGRSVDDEDYFYASNRGKCSVTLDLKHPEGQRVAFELASQADVIVENFTPGVVDRLGLGYERVSGSNPDIVYCSISGFGQSGPYRTWKGYDSIIQAMSGSMSITGEPDGPPLRAGLMIGDLSGALYAAIGILGALVHRGNGGGGQYIDISMHSSLVSLLSVSAAEYLANGRVPSASGAENPNRAPSKTQQAGDGRYLHIMAATPNLWRAFCTAVELEELLDDPRFKEHADRLKNREELNEIIANRLKERSADEWLEILREAGVPCGPVLNVGEVLSDEHLAEVGMLQTMEHRRSGTLRTIGSPLAMSRTPARIRRPPPLLGEHVAEVLSTWLEYPEERIAELREQGAFG
jgi:crotonobetainyl-CoA:carnitine CoA-transferase CaiB-like acyl-CoA transferase